MRTYTVNVEDQGRTVTLTLNSKFGDGVHAMADFRHRLGYGYGHYDGRNTITLK